MCNVEINDSWILRKRLNFSYLVELTETLLLLIFNSFNKIFRFIRGRWGIFEIYFQSKKLLQFSDNRHLIFNLFSYQSRFSISGLFGAFVSSLLKKKMSDITINGKQLRKLYNSLKIFCKTSIVSFFYFVTKFLYNFFFFWKKPLLSLLNFENSSILHHCNWHDSFYMYKFSLNAWKNKDTYNL